MLLTFISDLQTKRLKKLQALKKCKLTLKGHADNRDDTHVPLQVQQEVFACKDFLRSSRYILVVDLCTQEEKR